MEPRHLVRAAIVVSVLGHLLLAAGLILADARPFAPVATESIAVDIVTPQEATQVKEAAASPEPPKPADPFRLPELSNLDHPQQSAAQAAAKAAPPAAQQAAPAAQQAAAPAAQQAAPAAQPTPPPSQQVSRPQATSPQGDAPPPSPPQPPQQVAQPQPSAPPAAPEPDLTVKYGVMLGLPAGDGGAAAFTKADIAPLDTAAFRRHLKSCSTLPGSVTAGDKVRIVLRAYFARDGRLAAPPTLIEASASAKGPALMQAAINALQACQPYAMLPADKYKEWRVLDLPFTPQDFAGG